MHPDEALLQEIVRRILSVSHPDRIILFGSAATGDMTSDSDIDLLILERDRESIARDHDRVWAALRDVRIPVDLLYLITDKYERTKNLHGGIAYPAEHHGRVLYDRG